MTDTTPAVRIAPVELMLTPAIREALGLFCSVIKSGEPWAATCQNVYLDALRELDRLAALAAAPVAPAVRIAPTDAMILAGAKAAQSAEAHHVSWKDAALSVWSAMLAAAPVAPGEGEIPPFDPDAPELVQGATLCAEAIERFPNWIDNHDLITARAHAVVLAQDLPAALRARSEPAALDAAGEDVAELQDAVDQFISDAIANGSVEIDGDDKIGWTRPDLVRTLVEALAGCGLVITPSRNTSASISDLERIEKSLRNGGWHEGTNALTALIEALRARSEPEAGAVAWSCNTCNSPRAVDPCPKCGTALTKPADGWEWPGLPDINRIRELAREVGYAVGVHGTMERDLDLIAAPWVAEAVGPLELAQHIASGLGGEVVKGDVQDKPCGRWSCNIHTPDWTKLIDLSVMPAHPAPSDDPSSTERMRAAVLLAADTFERYADLHRAKGTPDGLGKAETNAALGRQMRAALGEA